MLLFKVELGGFEPWLWAYHQFLGRQHEGWTQQPDHWTLFFFEHAGTMTINNRPLPYQPGEVGFVVPGAKVSFSRIGEGTEVYHLTFAIKPRTETVVIPAVASLGDLTEIRRQEMAESFEWLQTSIMRGLACTYNLLWSIARPVENYRKFDLVYEAEALIIKRIAQPISIGDLANELAISHAHLLRLFRQEHNCTIQEYVRDKRVELAAQMLRDGDTAIKEVAARVGIPDLQYFNKVIRSSTGLSPSAFRAQALGRTRH